MNINHSTSRIIHTPAMTEFDFTLASSTQDALISAGGSSTTTDKDASITTYTTSTVRHDAKLTADAPLSNNPGSTVFTSLDTGIGTIAGDVLQRVSDGTCRVLARNKTLTKRIDVALSQTSAATTVVLNNFVSGSAARACVDAIDSRISGKTLDANGAIFSGNTRLSSCWAAGIDTTCISSDNRATAITANHVYGVNHYKPPSALTFVAMDGTVVSRYITSYVSPVGAAGTDIYVGVLNAALPGSITPAKVMPASFLTTRTPGYIYGLPVLATNQYKQAVVMELWMKSGTLRFRKPTTTARQALYLNTPIDFDSGSPVFAVVGTVLTLLTGWTSTVSGTDVSDWITEINAAITSLGGGGSFSTVDLSAYASY